MVRGRKGQAALIDIAMLTIIVTCAFAFVQLYSVTHASTQIDNLKYRMTGEYAQNTLLALSYCTAAETGYDTVQTNAVGEVYDEDLEALVSAADEVREYARSLDARLANWSGDIEGFREDVLTGLDDTAGEIDGLNTEITGKSDLLTGSLDEATGECENFLAELQDYGDLIGGIDIPEEEDTNPCEYMADLSDDASALTQTVTDNLTLLKYAVLDLREDVEDMEYESALESIRKARCILGEIEVKTDRFITYAQLGVDADASLMDLLPARAGLDAKTVTDIIRESFYVEDRLASSGYAKTLATIGARAAISTTEDGLENPKGQIIQGTALTFLREEYRELAKSSVQDSLELLLTEQGYQYCFRAEDCCSWIEAGSCEDVPAGSVRAIKTLESSTGDPIEMTLDIWR